MQSFALGRTRQTASNAGLANRAGFTLVELLVVLGIIAVLLGILLPAAARAREQSRRVKCAANLHDLGGSCLQFANDHHGWFPGAYEMPDLTNPYRFPCVFTQDTSFDTAGWKTYGTSWATWQRYGITDQKMTCPSSDIAFRYLWPIAPISPATEDANPIAPLGWPAATPNAAVAPANWGPVVFTDYMYVGGLTTTNVGLSKPNWGTAPPASSTSDTDLSEKVLAADLVFYTGGPATVWGKSGVRNYQINHPRTADPTMPDFQNVLYADGHVEGHGRDYFTSPLNTVSNFSLEQSTLNNNGGFFYWDLPRADPPASMPTTLPSPPGGGGGGGPGPVPPVPLPPANPNSPPPLPPGPLVPPPLGA